MTQVRRAVGLVFLALVLAVTPAASAAPAPTITHTPPDSVVPGDQVYLSATLTGASSASVAWRNGTMTAEATVPMTNLSRSDDVGWLYAAYLPAQPDPTQVSYTITASGPGGTVSRSYTFLVDVPGSSGLTEADQAAWLLTLASCLAIVLCVSTVVYWYAGRRLRREAA